MLYPINNLLKKDVDFYWNKACHTAFNKVKNELISEKVLVHYNPSLPLVLATDASPIGVGAVLSHSYPDGSERPIMFASQTLSKTQQAYSQIDKEAYAIIFGIRKFYQYLFGRRFTLMTDNKPLEQILSPQKGLPTLSATRMLHYAVFLQGFNVDIIFRKSNDHANADKMSRLPVNDKYEFNCDEVDLIEMDQINTLPVTVKELADATKAEEEVE